jgi:GST-like protein
VQFTSGFVGLNPNSKIPAMLDNSTSPPTRVFESAAILIYLAEKYSRTDLWPTDPAMRAEVLSWLMWQVRAVH